MSDNEVINGESSDEQRVTGDESVTWWHWHRRLYNWVVHFADTPHGERALFVLSFAESSFFPVPPDVLLAPLALGAPKKWFRFAFACSIASVLGGILGYMIGIALWAGVGNFFHEHVPGFSRDKVVLASGEELEGLFDPERIDVSMPLMKPTLNYPLSFLCSGETHELSEENVETVEVNPFTRVGAAYREHDWKVVATAGFTPLPFKVITITAGVFKINFLVFCIASVLSRSARFFIVSGLMGWKGEKIRPVIEKYFNWFSLAFVILLIGGFLVIKWIH
jgi:membrane protein YqaA with SNARE-associated domain